MDEAFARYFMEKGQYHTNPKNVLTRLNFIKNILPVKYLDELDKNTLNNYVINRRNSVKNGTINRELSIMSAIRNLADEAWDCKTNKANPLKFKLSEPAENIKYLKDWQTAQKIIDNAAEHLKPIIYTALYTAMRRGNILSLKWEQIDFVNNFLNIKVKDKNTIGGKNLSIPMIKNLRDILSSLPRINEYVFNYQGKPIKDIKHSWHSIFYEKGKLKDPTLPYINFHTLRHTALTWIVKNTGDILVAQKIAGHADIKTTTKYAHVLDEKKRQALESTFN